MYLRELLAVLADELHLVGERRLGFGADIVKDVRVACLGQRRVDRGEDLRSHGDHAAAMARRRAKERGLRLLAGGAEKDFAAVESSLALLCCR